ncbi:MAG: hypothetical protein KC978_07740, partial [Candidatus Omnitrophica bacterium]|nr:hypothetical protein [Candidatus Omnitrophota bacterium]
MRNRLQLQVLLSISVVLLMTTPTVAEPSEPIQIDGVFPSLTIHADGVGSRSETGIGALIPWANKLWAIGYVAHKTGEGIGLYEISEDMT